LRKVLREEKKFLIGIHEYIVKSHQLEKVLMQDENNGLDGYKVRSLYFDTPFDDDFYEKQAGVNVRRKIRLRIYDPYQDFALLEMKQKQSKNQLKRSLRLTRAEAERIIKGDFSPLLKHEEPFAAELYGFINMKGYRPKAIVEYDRKAFIARENKIRITFDSNIRATESSFDLFSEKLILNPVIDPYDVIMEVKFNGFLLSYIKDIVNSIDKSELSVSKYILARQNAYNTHIF